MSEDPQMTVEEAREVLAGLDPLFGPPREQIRQLNSLAANWIGGDRLNILMQASRIELALSTIRASEEDR